MLRESLDGAWKTIVAALAFATGLIATRLSFQNIGINLPRLPAQAPEEIAGWYLLAGSIALAAGILLPARGLQGSIPIRWGALSVFLILGFSVSTTIESSIYSSVNGVVLLSALLILPCLLLSGVAVLLFNTGFSKENAIRPVAEAFGNRTWIQWSWRFMAVIAVFPTVYFIFGILVSPIVSDYYAQGISGLVLPDPGVIVSTQFLRGALHLLAVLPLVVLWNRSQRQLIISLGLAFFVFVTAYDFVFAYQVPVVLVLTHGLEVLTSSLVYAWIIVKILFNPIRGV